VSRACDRCLTRTWLLRELGGHLEPVRSHIAELLALGDEELVAAVGGRRRDQLTRQLADPDRAQARRDAEQAGVDLICRCDPAYPSRLRDLASPPAVLHVAGGVDRFLAATASEPVAIVGSRAASSYGTSVARCLALGLAAAGVPVISGMAMGIDTAAHQGALSVGRRARPLRGERAASPGATVAVLPGPASEPYPRGARGLHRRLVSAGSAVSEVPPGVGVRSWMFLARNRIIAGLAAMTIVVEAREGSAALLTAQYAAELGRFVGAVPGRITAPQAAGPNRLIKEGAQLVSGAQEVLDLLFEAGTRSAPADDRPELTSEQRAVLSAIEDGHDTPAALHRQGVLAGLAALASLELAGYVHRGAGGRFTVSP
jgi:DNA processing protein